MNRRTGSTALLLALIAASAVAVGCGDPYSGVSDHPAPSSADFPKATGQTLNRILNQSDGPTKLVVLPTQEVFDRGAERYGFGVFTAANESVTDAKVALYFAHGANGRALGPYPARVESLATRPAFTAQTTAQDPQAAKVVYVVDGAPLSKEGEWRVAALVRDGGSLEGSYLPSAVVGHSEAVKGKLSAKTAVNPPDVGQPAPRIHTPTAASVGGDLSRIDTRIPHDDMHDVDFADILGTKPVVLLFATPQFCQSRVCGPVVDEAEQLKQRFGDRVAFIHMEIYNDNDPNKGTRPQVNAFRLPSEPWLFVIARNGIIRTRIEGAFSTTELERAVRGVLSG